MKVVIIGAGAIGAYLGAKLAAQGHQVGALARGATLAALQKHGWRIESQPAAPLHHAADTAEALLALTGTPDLLIIALKGFAVPELAPQLKALIGPNTIVLSAMNGIPWWFFQGFGGPAQGMELPCVDPAGVIAASIAPERVLGCVVHMTCSTPEPGLVRHGFGNRLIVGEPNGSISERATAVAQALAAAGFDAPVVPDIHREIWYKLWGNLTSNPISALTLATMDKLLADKLVSDYCLAIMREASEIGSQIGCAIAQTGEQRMDVARQLGAFKTSMLQDREAGRPMEVDGLVTATHLIGRRVGVPTPFLDSLLGLIRLLEANLAATRN